MSTIQLLDEDVINKIAAGEVVERPASVVKELTENAIDAGARQIRIELGRGGKDLIIVADDGKGISKAELPLALLRHATSKITCADDLYHLNSMGFRGEALASIAAVSSLTLSSKTSDSQGWSIAGEGSAELSPWSGPTGTDTGTTVVVNNLFAKIPARLNFLKSDAAEFGAVHDLLTQIALSHPAVGFEIVHNQKVHSSWERCEDLSVASYRRRAAQVLGQDSTAGLLEIKEESRFVQVTGFVSPPGLEKANGRFIFMFVNGRAIKDKNLRFALQRAYESHLLKGKSPVAVLNFSMSPELVDVNVHPAKTEVRFQYPLEVEGALVKAVRTALRSGSWAMPQAASTFVSESVVSEVRDFGFTSAASRPGFSQRSPGPSFASRMGGSGGGIPNALRAGNDDGVLRAGNDGASLRLGHDVISTAFEGPRVFWSEVKYLGTFSKLYLLFEWQDYLLVVDQHAFHERILFEKFMKDPQLLKTSQKLLVPEVVDLSVDEMETLDRLHPSLKTWGYDVSVVGSESAEIRSVPTLIRGQDLDSLLRSLLRGGKDASEVAEINMHHVIATAACHTAVRAGEELAPDELNELLRQASTVDFYHNCPHGRRVLSWWTRNDVAKLFDRPGSSSTAFVNTSESREQLF